MELLSLENEIVSEFEIFDNWMEKYEYLIELGKDLPIIDSAQKTEENLKTGSINKVGYNTQEN